MKKKEVCISGIGMITSLGTGWRKFWKNLLAGKTGIRPTEIFKFPVDPAETALHMAASMAIDDAGINSLLLTQQLLQLL